jgi:hypothetical protein
MFRSMEEDVTEYGEYYTKKSFIISNLHQMFRNQILK